MLTNDLHSKLKQLPIHLFLMGGLIVLLNGCGRSPLAEFWKAVHTYEAKDMVATDRSLRKVLNLQSDFVPAYLLLARMAVEREDTPVADLNYLTAYDIMSARKFVLQPEDIEAMNSSLKLDWRESAMYLADREFQKGDYARATGFYTAVINGPSDGDWQQKAFQAREVIRDFNIYRDRLETLRKQNIQNPQDPRVKAEIASLFMELASGLSRLEKLQAVSEHIAMAAEFREQGRLALTKIKEASPGLELPQTEALLTFTESQEMLMRGRLDEALEKAQQAVVKDPNNPRFVFAVSSILSLIAARENNPSYRLEERLRSTQKAIELSPENWRYLIVYAGLLREGGRIQESYDWLVKARAKVTEKQVIDEIDSLLASLEKSLATTSPQTVPTP